MNEALNLTPPTKAAKAPKAPKAPKAEKDPAAPKVERSSPLAKTFPKDATITVLTEGGANPKRAGTKAFDKFERYSRCKTVAEFVADGGKLTTLAWDTGHGFIKVG